jgi:hypothetical protein
LTTLTVLFALVLLLLGGAIALALVVLMRRDTPSRYLFLGLFLVVLAIAVLLVGIRDPLPLP